MRRHNVEVTRLVVRVLDHEREGSDKCRLAVEVSQELLRSGNVPFNTVLSSDVLATAGGDTAGLASGLEKKNAPMAKLEPVNRMAVRRNEKFFAEINQSHAGEIRVWKETSVESGNSLINCVMVAHVLSCKMSVKRTLLLVRFEEHVRSLQTWSMPTWNGRHFQRTPWQSLKSVLGASVR